MLNLNSYFTLNTKDLTIEHNVSSSDSTLKISFDKLVILLNKLNKDDENDSTDAEKTTLVNNEEVVEKESILLDNEELNKD